MKNRREYGIKFRMSYTSGIATIVVYDATDQEYVLSDGTKQQTYAERTVDLYLDSGFYEDNEKDFVYWITLEEEHTYTITVGRSGSTSAPGGETDLNIVSFLETEKLVDSEVSGLLTTYHTDDPSHQFVYEFTLYTYPLTDSSVAQQSDSLAKEQSFIVGSGGQSLFSLEDTNRAAKFIAVSIDNGESWLEPHEISFVWGSNAPYYTNETISIDGYFSILFSDAVVEGETVIIKFIPLVDRCRIDHTLIQPKALDASYSDLRAQTTFMNYVLEIIPEE